VRFKFFGTTVGFFDGPPRGPFFILIFWYFNKSLKVAFNYVSVNALNFKMIKLFNRKKVDINSVSIPDFEWGINQNDQWTKQWINPEHTISISLIFFDLIPNIPSLNDSNVLREFYRNELSAHNGGLIKVDSIDLKGFMVIKTIFKIPQESVGMTYLASLTIPFHKCSYVIKIQASETGITGMRDTIVAEKLIKDGKITLGENGCDG